MDSLRNLYPESSSDISDSDTEEELDQPIADSVTLINQSTVICNDKSLGIDLLTAVAGVSIKPKKTTISAEESSSDSGEESDTASIRTTGTTTRSVISQADRRPPSPYNGFQRAPLETSSITEDDFTLPPDIALTKIGTIRTILDNIIITESLPNGTPLDLHSVLFLSNRVPLGRIFDVFGPVIRPCYSLRFESEECFEHTVGLAVGADVFIAPSDPHLTSYIFVKDLIKQKGTDASWEDDGEAPDEMEEFSDDEQEKMAKQSRQRVKRPLGNTGEGRGRGGQPVRELKPAMNLPRPSTQSMRHFAGPNVFPVSRPMMTVEPGGFGAPMRYPQPLAYGAGSFPMRPMFRPPPPPPPISAEIRHRFTPPFLTSPTPITLPDQQSSAPIRPYGLNLASAPPSTNPVHPTVLSTSAPLVTDPKTLPSAEILFYDPKQDAALQGPRPSFNPRSFLR